MRGKLTLYVRAATLVGFILACILPSLVRVEVFPFLSYRMFVDEALNTSYYLPIAEVSSSNGSSEYLIKKSFELYPYRLTIHRSVSWLDLQTKIQMLIALNKTKELTELQHTWCDRVPRCRRVTIFRYDHLFSDGQMNLAGERVPVSSWQR